MYTVLIVEDEILVRIGIKNSIQWETLDMMVIGDASDGREAYELYQKFKPDLILTDIKMPVMDGLELISKIRETDKRAKIIILTCYEEFELVYKAIKFGVSDYILKLKMSPNEIYSLLLKVKEELINENLALTSSKKDINNSLSNLEGTIKDYIVLGKYTDSQFMDALEKLHCCFHERTVLCVMEICDFNNMQPGFEGNRNLSLGQTVYSIVSELINKTGKVFYVNDGKFILILELSSSLAETNIVQIAEDTLANINSTIKIYTNINAIFAIGNPGASFSACRCEYENCLNILEHFYFFNEKIYLWQKDVSPHEIKNLVKDRLNTLSDRLDLRGDYKGKIVDDIKNLLSGDSVQKSDIARLLVSWIYGYANNYIKLSESLSYSILDYVDRIRISPSFEESLEIYIDCINRIKKEITNDKLLSKEVTEAVEFVRNNYHKDITLQDLADHVEMSANYFSSLFKKEVGVGLNEYINRVRIEKAKDLLLNTHLKSYQIAEKVGFADESYFSQIFRKIVGHRPNEFKKQSSLNEGRENNGKMD